MERILTEVFRKYGIWPMVIGVIIAAVTWLLAHFSAAPKTEVSVLWGWVTYTKNGPEDPEVAASTGTSAALKSKRNEDIADPANTDNKVSLSFANPLSDIDRHLSVLLLKVEADRARVQFNINSPVKKEKRLFLFKNKPQKVETDQGNYAFRLLDIMGSDEIRLAYQKY